MNSFTGTYECKIDAKGRVKIPTALAAQMEAFSLDPFVIKRSVFSKCLEVYPMSGWEKMMDKINRLNRFVKKNADFIRMFTAGVKVVPMDKSGRLQVTKDLVQFAGLEKDLVLASAGEVIEIWDKTAYEKVIATNEKDFAALAEEVMGSINWGDVS